MVTSINFAFPVVSYFIIAQNILQTFLKLHEITEACNCHGICFARILKKKIINFCLLYDDDDYNTFSWIIGTFQIRRHYIL